MAKFPRSGARRMVAEFVQKNLNHDGIDKVKAIQPQILSSMGDTFFWSVKIISIHTDTSGVGIQRKYEEGFEVVEDNGKKLKSILRVMGTEHNKAIMDRSKKKSLSLKNTKSRLGLTVARKR